MAIVAPLPDGGSSRFHRQSTDAPQSAGVVSQGRSGEQGERTRLCRAADPRDFRVRRDSLNCDSGRTAPARRSDRCGTRSLGCRSGHPRGAERRRLFPRTHGVGPDESSRRSPGLYGRCAGPTAMSCSMEEPRAACGTCSAHPRRMRGQPARCCDVLRGVASRPTLHRFRSAMVAIARRCPFALDGSFRSCELCVRPDQRKR